eukprot:TRINITY_DN7169_c0_g2_i1.p1 TRINITY_DN7169_c0_g2~~TRINITY_DN7169_c0_g2_i1.p1  ORF type:complete len:192 (-),score=-25.84 TRINITY_DN7169_c0_g2_i1:644-1192(-)
MASWGLGHRDQFELTKYSNQKCWDQRESTVLTKNINCAVQGKISPSTFSYPLLTIVQVFFIVVIQPVIQTVCCNCKQISKLKHSIVVPQLILLEYCKSNIFLVVFMNCYISLDSCIYSNYTSFCSLHCSNILFLQYIVSQLFFISKINYLVSSCKVFCCFFQSYNASTEHQFLEKWIKFKIF